MKTIGTFIWNALCESVNFEKFWSVLRGFIGKINQRPWRLIGSKTGNCVIGSDECLPLADVTSGWLTALPVSCRYFRFYFPAYDDTFGQLATLPVLLPSRWRHSRMTSFYFFGRQNKRQFHSLTGICAPLTEVFQSRFDHFHPDICLLRIRILLFTPILDFWLQPHS